MTRSLYRCLLRLHPAEFRRQFADEMLWIFDQVSGAESPASLFADGFLSLVRQWVLRAGMWKLAVAGAGGLLEIALACYLVGGPMETTHIVASGFAQSSDAALDRFSG